MSLSVFASIVWALTVGMVGVLLVERTRGRRYFPSLRGRFDTVIGELYSSWQAQIPSINRLFFRQLFHYGVHVVFSRLLKIFQWGERATRTIVQFNRKKAVTTAVVNPDSHLGKIAAHKEESALSHSQKKAKKDAALRG